MEKLRIARPIIVEGKYDKITLGSVVDATILTTDGFGLFNNREKAMLLRRLAEKNGVIVLTDSDGGGRQIRSFLRGILPKEKVTHLYIPTLPGKERRKSHAGKAGLLGVEGMKAALLYELLSPFAEGQGEQKESAPPLTKTDLYLLGLSGRDGSAQRRREVCLALAFPPDMTANALLEAVNLLYTPDDFRAKLEELFPSEE